MKNIPHPFHLVTNRPWPIIVSISLLNLTIGIIFIFNFKIYRLIIFRLITIIICRYQWWRDITRESTFQGFHTKNILNHIGKGILLFIISEIIFFFSFFWGFFHMILSPRIEIGRIWPPKGVDIFNPFNIPLLNTIILLTSGIFITWSHFCILKKTYFLSKISILITIFLGLLFTYFQYIEYKNSIYSINDSSYGTTFFYYYRVPWYSCNHWNIIYYIFIFTTL